VAVSLGRRGYEFQSGELPDAEPGEARARVTLNRGWVSDVRFVDANGDPVEGGVVMVEQPGPQVGDCVRLGCCVDIGPLDESALSMLEHNGWSQLSLPSDLHGVARITAIPRDANRAMIMTWRIAALDATGNGSLLPGESIEINVETGEIRHLAQRDAPPRSEESQTAPSDPPVRDEPGTEESGR
jgi:hypothetical protein